MPTKEYPTLERNEFYYILGFLYADGSVKKAGAIDLRNSVKDLDIFIKISKILGVDIKQGVSKIKEKEYSTVSIYIPVSKSKMFLEHGLEQRKTYSNSTSIFDNIPLEYKRDFIRGYFDGDGTVFEANQFIFSIVSLNKNILIKTQKYFEDVIQYSISIRVDKKYWRLTAKGNYIVSRIRDEIYYPDCLCLERKREKLYSIQTDKTNYTHYYEHSTTGVTYHSSIKRWQVRYNGKYIGIKDTQESAIELLNQYKRSLP